jgi:hypothetical protein
MTAADKPVIASEPIALDIEGHPSVSPAARRAAEDEYRHYVARLEIEVAALRRAVADKDAELRRLRETWQARLEDEVRLRMRGTRVPERP